ncbi:MAG: hypothetical protein KC416_06220 [Myxococcales bacterium]|nr:hypothetical protein [Myxococcales bacterium]
MMMTTAPSISTRLLFAGLLLGLAWASPGCDSKSDEQGKVPFGLRPKGKDAPGPESGDPDPAPNAGKKADNGPKPLAALATESPRVDVEGSTLSTSEGEILAVFPVDPDGDGDRDAFVLVRHPERLAIAFGERLEESFAAPKSLGTIPWTGPSCQVTQATGQDLSKHFVVLGATIDCDGDVRQTHVVLSRDGKPRLLDTLTLLAPESDQDSELGLEFALKDTDGDGTDDLQAAVSVNGTPPFRLETSWLNRAGSIALDSTGIQKQLASLLSAKDSAGSAGSREVVRIFNLLCDHSRTGARILAGPQRGLRCHSDDIALAALLEMGIDHADKGEVMEAVALQRAIDREGQRTEPLQKAIEKRAQQVATESLGPLPALATLPVHLPRIAFQDPNTLILRGDLEKRYDLSTGGWTDGTPSGRGTAIVDPQGQTAIVALERECDRIVARTGPASDVMAGAFLGKPQGELPIARAAPLADVPCGQVPASLRTRTDGWHVLGWAPQGVVAANLDQVVVIEPPRGEGAATAIPLDKTAPLPAPLPSGTATQDGLTYALPTPFGIAVITRGARPREVLLRPASWKAAQPLSDVTISPDGRAIAYVAGGSIHLVRSWRSD